MQAEIHKCMNEIEVSINLSMSGMSFQPQNATNNNVPVKSVKAPVPNQKTQTSDYYPATSTTPTDVMDVSKACVY